MEVRRIRDGKEGDAIVVDEVVKPPRRRYGAVFEEHNDEVRSDEEG